MTSPWTLPSATWQDLPTGTVTFLFTIQAVERLRSMLGEAELNSLWAERWTMMLDEAIQFALDSADGTT